MLFNSPVFVFYFLPGVLCIALLLRSRTPTVVPFLSFLALASLAFYSYTNPAWLLLILGSIGTNYLVGQALNRDRAFRRALLTAGVGFNLGFLGYFKYADFLIINSNALFGTSSPALDILLPIGISFYTFQQIAYLVDVFREPKCQHRFLDYLVFVSFFPQLIAGPIVHHKELIPQLARVRERPIIPDLTIGLTIFFIGLAKKVLLADTFGQYANQLFDSPAVSTSTVECWIGVTAYSLQIYFDFSGYSDMAIGLGRMFGLRLPINFDSPYRATSIIDFWRRWHITLSRFLKDYLYISLGGNRKGNARRFVNLLVTMLLGGLWHGAGWGFVIWGGLHGLYLCINHALRALHLPRWLAALGWPVTLVAVVVAWVPFRAVDLDATLAIWRAMFSFGDSWSSEAANMVTLTHIAIGICIVCFAPNSQQIMQAIFRDPATPGTPDTGARAGLPRYVMPTFAAIVGFAAAAGLAMNNRIAEFLYFQF